MVTLHYFFRVVFVCPRLIVAHLCMVGVCCAVCPVGCAPNISSSAWCWPQPQQIPITTAGHQRTHTAHQQHTTHPPGHSQVSKTAAAPSRGQATHSRCCSCSSSSRGCTPCRGSGVLQQRSSSQHCEQWWCCGAVGPCCLRQQQHSDRCTGPAGCQPA